MQAKTLVTVADLKAALGDPDLCVVDARFSLADTEAGRRAYGEGHLPGAIYAHLDEDLSGPIVAGVTGRHPLPDHAEMVARFGAMGIDSDVQVVVYDDMGGAVAARLWWMLRFLGHARVAVLDGGMPAWRAAGGALTTRPGTRAPRVFKPGTPLTDMMEADAVAASVAAARIDLVDSRGAVRYRGEEEPIDPVAGHIPGACNLPFAENLGADGLFQSPDALRARFRDLGAGGKPVVFYCGSGVTAAHNILAMTHAGLDGAVLYPGSWSGWIAPGTRPVAVG